MRITAVPHGTVDGISLNRFQVGLVYDVGTLVGALLLAEGWAEPEDDTYPALVTRLTGVQAFAERSAEGQVVPVFERRRFPRSSQSDLAADRPRRRRKRSRK